MDYLTYAYLQGAQDVAAKRVLDEMNAIGKVNMEHLVTAYALAAIPARYALERRRWTDAASLKLAEREFPWSRYPQAEALIYFARALGSARTRDTDAARKATEKLQSLRDDLVKANQTYWADQVEIQRRGAAAWLSRAEGRNDEALQLMRSAADLEDTTEKHPLTPGPIVPAHELLGDLLLELNEPGKALKEFETSFLKEPNRFHGIYGAARAAELSGDQQKARTYYAELRALCEHFDSERPELQQAKAFLAKK
jgi:predicted Zn-dependent protease